jgi:hypothetical protein
MVGVREKVGVIVNVGVTVKVEVSVKVGVMEGVMEGVNVSSAVRVGGMVAESVSAAVGTTKVGINVGSDGPQAVAASMSRVVMATNK